MKNKEILIISILIILIIVSLFYLSGEEEEVIETPTETEEGINLDEAIESAEKIFELGEEIISLEEELGSERSDIFESYNRIENDFFILRDKYYEGEIDRKQLKNKIENLLLQMDALEADLKEIINEEK